ncbi:MAG TPA: hypothetical protein VJA46_03600 [Acidimicrobiia bacterium]|nr:hypothetical protein [Acidimicrobiia bacterium]
MHRSRFVLLALVAVALGACESEEVDAGATTSLVSTTSTSSLTTTSVAATSTLAPTTSLATTGTGSTELVEYDGSAYGFVMLLPASWTAIAPDDFDFGSLSEEMVDLYGQELADQATAIVSQGGVLFALAPDTGSGFVNNINVIQGPTTGATAADLEQAYIDEIPLIGAEIIETGIVSIPVGEAAVARYSIPDFGVAGVGYWIIADDSEWVITLSYSDSAPLGFDFEEIVNSFQVVDR